MGDMADSQIQDMDSEAGYEGRDLGPGDELDAFRHQKRIDDEQITQLKADLDKFGGHTADCAVNIPLSGIQSRSTLLDGNECDCGYKEAKERWK